VSGGRGGAVGGWEGGGFGRQLNGFWEKAGMEWWVSIDGNVSVSLLSHLWILPTPSHPFLFAIKTTTKRASAWSQQGNIFQSNALYVSQIQIHRNTRNKPTPAYKKHHVSIMSLKLHYTPTPEPLQGASFVVRIISPKNEHFVIYSDLMLIQTSMTFFLS